MKNTKLSLGLVALAAFMVAASSFAGGPPPQTSPDAGSSALLMSCGIAGIAALKKFIR